MVVWHIGRMSVSVSLCWQTFPVLYSTCSRWVTTIVGKPSSTSQPTKRNQWVDKWVVSLNRLCATVYTVGTVLCKLWKWPQAWQKVMAAYRPAYGLKSPAGWLPVHQDQLRAQRLITSIGILSIFLNTNHLTNYNCVQYKFVSKNIPETQIPVCCWQSNNQA